MVIGVHSAKFTNEKESDNIRQAIIRHDIDHPVVNDAEMKIWEAYRPFGVRGWPSFILVGPGGEYLGYASGELKAESLYPKLDAVIKMYDDKIDRKILKFAPEKDKVKPTTLSFPGKILATDDRLFIADTKHHRILVTDLKGQVLETVGGPEEGRKDGGFKAARFDEPQGMAVRGSKLYVADRENHLIREVDFDKKRVRTLAGMGTRGYRLTTGPALEIALASPWALALHGDRLFIAMAGTHQIWVLDLKKNRVGPHSGSGREELADGPHAVAAYNQPSGLSIGNGRLYVADSEVSGVRETDLRPTGGVRTILGTGLFKFGDKDGIGREALLQHVLGVAWHDGKLYIADAYNHKIKICDPKTRKVETFLGDGKPGHVDGKAARFFEPSGLSIAGGKLYVADQNNHVIRICDLATKEVSTLEIKGAR